MGRLCTTLDFDFCVQKNCLRKIIYGSRYIEPELAVETARLCPATSGHVRPCQAIQPTNKNIIIFQNYLARDRPIITRTINICTGSLSDSRTFAYNLTFCSVINWIFRPGSGNLDCSLEEGNGQLTSTSRNRIMANSISFLISDGKQIRFLSKYKYYVYFDSRPGPIMQWFIASRQFAPNWLPHKNNLFRGSCFWPKISNQSCCSSKTSVKSIYGILS